MIFICAISLPVQGFCYYRLYYCGSFLSGMNMSQDVLFTRLGTSIKGPVGLEEGGSIITETTSTLLCWTCPSCS